MLDDLSEGRAVAPAGAEPRAFPLLRPAPMARAATRAARHYERRRDLPGALPGLLARPEAQILPKLAEAEARCEAARRSGAAGYRPARHLQILAALLAETALAARAGGPAQPKASGSSALRRAT